MNAWSSPPSPYAPPGSWAAHPSSYPPPPAPGPNASTVLYSPNQIFLAAFLGSPIAGAVLMAINEQRLGRPKGVLSSLGAGFGLTALMLGIGAVLGDKAPGLPLTLAGLAAMRGLAQTKQAEAVTRHLHWGGRKGSSWAAAGIGVLSGIVVLVAVIAVGAAYALVTGAGLE